MERVKGPLQPQHHAAIRLKLEGASPSDIAVQLGVKERTVHLWFSDDTIKAELREKLKEIDAAFVTRMAEIGMVGIHELVTMARMPIKDETLTPEQKLEVVTQILDRVPQTAPVGQRGGRQDPVGGVQIFNMPVGQLSDEQLIERAAQLTGKGGPALLEGMTGESADPDTS